MKRICLSILFIVSALITQARQPVADIVKSKSGHFEVADSRIPYTEFEVAMTGQTGTAITPSFKKFAGTIPTTVVLPQASIIYTASAEPVIYSACSKNYLHHIYPFLHFW